MTEPDVRLDPDAALRVAAELAELADRLHGDVAAARHGRPAGGAGWRRGRGS